MRSESEYNAKFEAILSRAVNENFERELNEFTDAELAEMYTVPERHQTRMEKLFKKEKRRASLHTAAVYTRRAAIVITAFLGLSLLNKDVRANIRGLIVEIYEKFISISFTGSDTEGKTEWRPTYLPEGFIETDVLEYGAFTDIQYTNDEGITITLTYSLAKEGLNISVDSEKRQYSSILINGEEALLFIAESERYENCIAWRQGGYMFDLWSLVDLEELQKIAESVDEK